MNMKRMILKSDLNTNNSEKYEGVKKWWRQDFQSEGGAHWIYS